MSAGLDSGDSREADVSVLGRLTDREARLLPPAPQEGAECRHVDDLRSGVGSWGRARLTDGFGRRHTLNVPQMLQCILDEAFAC